LNLRWSKKSAQIQKRNAIIETNALQAQRTGRRLLKDLGDTVFLKKLLEQIKLLLGAYSISQKQGQMKKSTKDYMSILFQNYWRALSTVGTRENHYLQ